jgi:hypothetical protein
MFHDKNDRALWIKQGLGDKSYYTIGKFRSEPCASGKYVWLDYQEYQIFECFYTEINEESVKG